MYLTKVFILDENQLFPNCNQCGNELSPFCVTTKELSNITVMQMGLFLQSELLIMSGISRHKHILFLCKHCNDIKKEKL